MSVVRFLCTCDDVALPPLTTGDASVAIRPADLAVGNDRAAIAALARAAAWPRGADDGDPFRADPFRAELTGRPGRAITVWLAVGESPSSAVGLVALCRTRGGWSIPWLLVHPAVRRRGVARLLVAVALTHARTQGAATVTTESLSSWPDAVAFWRAAGFTQRPGDDEVL